MNDIEQLEITYRTLGGVIARIKSDYEASQRKAIEIPGFGYAIFGPGALIRAASPAEVTELTGKEHAYDSNSKVVEVTPNYGIRSSDLAKVHAPHTANSAVTTCDQNLKATSNAAREV
jgi:hypothetical protein